MSYARLTERAELQHIASARSHPGRNQVGAIELLRPDGERHVAGKHSIISENQTQIEALRRNRAKLIEQSEETLTRSRALLERLDALLSKAEKRDAPL